MLRFHTIRTRRLVGAVIGLLLAILACTLAGPDTTTPAPTVTLTPAPTRAATATPDIAATQRVIRDAEGTATEAGRSTATAQSEAKATRTAAERLAQRATTTARAVVQSTQDAQSMYTAISQLRSEGYLSSDQGRFYSIPNFLESWAQLNYYGFWDTGYTPTNFVVRADTHWESASNTADWWNTGCGFVFRSQGEDDHYLAYLGLDGYVNFSGFRKREYFDVGRAYYGKVDVPLGKAQVMLMVEGDKFTYYVNGERVTTQLDNRLDAGALALTLVSGTNKSFGTRCRMTNVELWQLPD